MTSLDSLGEFFVQQMIASHIHPNVDNVYCVLYAPLAPLNQLLCPDSGSDPIPSRFIGSASQPGDKACVVAPSATLPACHLC